MKKTHKDDMNAFVACFGSIDETYGLIPAAKLFSSSKCLCQVILEPRVQKPSRVEASAIAYTFAVLGRSWSSSVSIICTERNFGRLRDDYESILLVVNLSWARLFNTSIRGGGSSHRWRSKALFVPEDEALRGRWNLTISSGQPRVKDAEGE
ncbi:unnamed protein product [Clonostachys solani]|uniref:Uncharacterized protein n=1 Tax=Clonostachys solani TaxID=160281 RepID=A0A9N9W3I8_9HYPO|nr:unnamed protein product [Clonostachys solani]